MYINQISNLFYDYLPVYSVNGHPNKAAKYVFYSNLTLFMSAFKKKPLKV